jgi:DNA-binding XRE family transcriptional regulator
MFPRYIESCDTVSIWLINDSSGQWCPQGELADGVLCGDLPDAGHTQENVELRIFDDRPSPMGKPRMVDSGRQLPAQELLAATLPLDRASLAGRLIRRRRITGLSQAELARRAGIRPETVNRIERGRTTPDFATIRKLVEALRAGEEADGQEVKRKETDHV